jgi:hypothetical protein
MARPLQFPTVAIDLSYNDIVDSTSLKYPYPQAEDLYAAVLDTLIVANIDNDENQELILPAFAANYPQAVAKDAPIWIIDISANSIGNIDLLTYQSSRRALLMKYEPEAKALVFQPFTDVWPEVAPGYLFTPSSEGFNRTELNKYQTHGPSSGEFYDNGETYLIVPSQWSDVTSSPKLLIARLNQEKNDLIYTDLGYELGADSSAVIKATSTTGPAIFLGQSYLDGDIRSDVILPITIADDGTPSVDKSRSMQVFHDYWNQAENFAFAKQFPEIVLYDSENPQSTMDYSHVVTAESVDLNGDGLPDIISAHAYRNPSTNLMALVPYIQQSDGTFKEETASRFVDFEYEEDVPYRLFTHDLNNDGHIDIAFGSQMWDDTPATSSSAGVYLNDGLGHFVRAATDDYLIDLLNQSQLAIVDSETGPQVVRIDITANTSLWPPQIQIDLFKTKQNHTGPNGIDPAEHGAPGFNEWFYLYNNPDVAQAIENGTYSNGLAHYLEIGRSESREAFAPGSVITGTESIDNIYYATMKSEVTLHKESEEHWKLTRDGRSDQLHSIERIKLADEWIALDSEDSNSAGGIYRTYQAAFARTPDTGGFGYWIDHADKGASAVQMAEEFVWSEEFQNLYSVITADNFLSGNDIGRVVEGFYTNVLGRSPDQEGLNFYTAEIETQQRTAGRVLAEIADSNENRLMLAPTIDQGMLFDLWQG